MSNEDDLTVSDIVDWLHDQGVSTEAADLEGDIADAIDAIMRQITFEHVAPSTVNKRLDAIERTARKPEQLIGWDDPTPISARQALNGNLGLAFVNELLTRLKGWASGQAIEGEAILASSLPGSDAYPARFVQKARWTCFEKVERFS